MQCRRGFILQLKIGLVSVRLGDSSQDPSLSPSHLDLLTILDELYPPIKYSMGALFVGSATSNNYSDIETDSQ